ncbi:MAG: Crp/Fnr family transcriptional regulator [Croceitalea sp.]|nr:Crp/Fnr family transcriptional regulator [Croceitalea sp.]
MNIGLEKYRYYFETILENPVFENVPSASIENLLKITQSKTCERSTCLLDTHEISHFFFFVISGKVKAYIYDPETDRQLTLSLLSKNDLFDLNSLFGGFTHKVYYETLEHTETLCIPVPQMKSWLKQNPCIQPALINLLVKQLHALQNSVANIVMDDIGTRLAKLLYTHMDIKTGKIHLIDNLSHDELAALIGTTRSVVNRQLQVFRDNGIIEMGRKRIRVSNTSGLKAELDKSSR